jgi:hypothetical protein
MGGQTGGQHGVFLWDTTNCEQLNPPVTNLFDLDILHLTPPILRFLWSVLSIGRVIVKGRDL